MLCCRGERRVRADRVDVLRLLQRREEPKRFQHIVFGERGGHGLRVFRAGRLPRPETGHRVRSE